MNKIARAVHLVRREQGLTLVELLVAMVIGIVVVGATFTIFEVSLRQQAQIADKVQSDQLGRVLMTNIVDQLHSSCTGFKTTAIQAPESTPTSPLASSGPSDLWYISAYGSSSSSKAVITSVTLHDVHWAKTGTSNTGLELGTLTDYQFNNSSGSAGEWVFPELKTSNATARQLAVNVSPSNGSGNMFQYYAYNNKYGESSNGELSTSAMSTPLTTTTAKEVAKVQISFTQAPSDGDTRLGRTASFTSSVVLHFDPTTTGTKVVNAPCA